VRARSGSSGKGRGELRDAGAVLLAALRIRSDPTEFCRRTSRGVVGYLSGRGVPLHGARALDAGTGGGCVPEALQAAGASVVALDVGDHRLHGVGRTPFVLGRSESLPFSDHAFDLVISSNVLEHVPDTRGTLTELARVCRPRGHVYLSWTTWLSPLGGHELSPFHYLGPRFAVRAYRATRGRSPMNVPGRNLFAVSVGSVLRELRGFPLTIRDLAPRYWPSFRALGRIPGVREVALWNCVILLERR
jgi:SAM-dependent methyltransferase